MYGIVSINNILALVRNFVPHSGGQGRMRPPMRPPSSVSVTPSGTATNWYPRDDLASGLHDIRNIPHFSLMTNRTIFLGSAHRQVADASLEWAHVQKRSHFAVLPQLVPTDQITAIHNILRSTPFDADPDSVDWSSAHEFYLEVNNSLVALAAEPQKTDSEPEVFAARLPVREALLNVTRPILVSVSFSVCR